MTTVISLTIGGRAFSIEARDIAFSPVEPGSDICMSGIGIGGVGPFYLTTDWLVSFPSILSFIAGKKIYTPYLTYPSRLATYSSKTCTLAPTRARIKYRLPN